MTYDTKLISYRCGALENSWLGGAYKECLENSLLNDNIKISYAEGFERYLTESQEHEAAYDAYMTGVLFASATKYQEIINLVEEKVYNTPKHFELIKKFKRERYDGYTKWKMYEAFKAEHFHDHQHKFANKRINTEVLKEQENKAVMLSGKNRVFYFGTDVEEIKKSKDIQMDTSNVIWVKFLTEEVMDTDVAEYCSELGDIYVQKDGDKGMFIEFQHIYNDLYIIHDIIEQLQERLPGKIKVTTFGEAEKYTSMF